VQSPAGIEPAYRPAHSASPLTGNREAMERLFVTGGALVPLTGSQDIPATGLNIGKVSYTRGDTMCGSGKIPRARYQHVISLSKRSTELTSRTGRQFDFRNGVGRLSTLTGILISASVSPNDHKASYDF